MSDKNHKRVTTQHIHPAMKALFAARDADDSGDYAECSAQLRIVAAHVAKAALALSLLRIEHPAYVVPVDPQSELDCEACQ